MMVSFVESSGGRVAYEVHEPTAAASGRTLVCVPGLGDLRTAYRHNIAALTGAGHRVVTMDLPGHGDSDDGFSRYDVPVLGAAIIAVIDKVGAPAVVAGNSMGAAGAVWASVASPKAVEGLVLLAPFVRDPLVNWIAMTGQRLGLFRPWGPAVWRAYYRMLHRKKPADLTAHIAQIKAAMGRGSHWRSFIKTTHTSYEETESMLLLVDKPALVVMGTKDRDWPDPKFEGNFVATTLRGRLEMLDGVGHYPMAEDPTAVNELISEFVAAG